MKLKDFIEILRQYDENMEVVAACEGYGNLSPLQPDDVQLETYKGGRFDPERQVVSIMSQRCD